MSVYLFRSVLSPDKEAESSVAFSQKHCVIADAENGSVYKNVCFITREEPQNRLKDFLLGVILNDAKMVYFEDKGGKRNVANELATKNFSPAEIENVKAAYKAHYGKELVLVVIPFQPEQKKKPGIRQAARAAV